jgi:hypothetical protein
MNTKFCIPRTYRLDRSLSKELKTTSRILGCTESALVRKLLNDGIAELRARFDGR